MDEALESLSNIEPGDCIVCFNKQVGECFNIFWRCGSHSFKEDLAQNFLHLKAFRCWCLCVVSQDIYSVSRSLEKLGIECAVIYGSLPPGTKLAMAERFNDPHDPCKVRPHPTLITHFTELTIHWKKASPSFFKYKSEKTHLQILNLPLPWVRFEQL